MNKIITALILSFLCVLCVCAQNTKANGRKLFNEGRYDEAKPVFKRLLKGSPRSAEYNYWYAACCYETKDTAESIERIVDMLEYADSRNVLNAPYYLGCISFDERRYEDALERFTDFLSDAKDEARIALAEEKIVRLNELIRMIKVTERICVVDSFVVDKNEFLSAYRVGRDVGTLSFSFPSAHDEITAMYITERGTDRYYSSPVVDDNGTMTLKLFHSVKNGDHWQQGESLVGIDTGGDDNYPFMSADGITFYFASNGDGSIGGYDIFVTRYDNERGRFLKPVNMGMPFNSEADDYMLVINDVAGLGWFATSRRMPQDKVCVYVFVPNDSKQVYDYESMDYNRMLSLSRLESIADTQTDERVVRKARQQLTMLIYEQSSDMGNGDFLFVMDDMTDYTTLDDFKSPEARKLFVQWQKRSAQYAIDVKSLDNKRTDYAMAGKAEKIRMRSELLTLERRLENEEQSLETMKKEIRRIEYDYINR